MFKKFIDFLTKTKEERCEHDFCRVLSCSWCAHEGVNIDLGIGSGSATLRTCKNPDNRTGYCLSDITKDYDLTKCIRQLKICRKCGKKEIYYE